MPSLAHQFEPARCKRKLTVEDAYAGKIPEGWICEEKRDDCRYLLQIRPNGTKINYLTSRRISKITDEYVEKQDWMPAIRDFNFPKEYNDTILDGGTFDPSKPRGFASDVVNAMKEGRAHYCAFDIIRYKGKDVTKLPWTERRALLAITVRDLKHPLIVKSARIKKPAKEYLKQVIDSGGEGIVLKDPKSVYGVSWTKVKRKSTYDVVIMGFADPVSTIYASKGWIGALEIGQITKDKFGDLYYKTLGQVKNMTDELRATISKNRKKFIGKVVEISAETRLDSGKFRNPSVVQMRDDKSANQCVFNPENEA